MQKVLFALIVALPFQLFAQKKATPKPVAPPILYDSVYKSLVWRSIGPYRGGRTNTVSGVKGNRQVYYAGYTGGGVWKTVDAGITWSNISDGKFNTSTIGDIAVSVSDPNVIYVGTGEHAVRGVMTSFGDGVYKSEDGGSSWKHMGLTETRHISDVIIHPTNPDLVYVAAQGALHGNNAERGVYRSTDGGKTWRKTLFINDSTGISSLAMDPANPRILYAASWQHRRTPWSVISGGPGSAVWRSKDGGETWTKLSRGLPTELGKIGLSVSGANASRIYAIVETEKSKSGIYRSDDGGESWSLLSTNQDLTARSWYYMEVCADPRNENVVYVMNAPLMKSIDGGKTWSRLSIGHGDTHDLWINPDDSENLVLSDDGGASISFNGGKTWSTLNNQPTAQFYRVNTDNVFPYKVYGGQQDNTSVIIKSRTNGGSIGMSDWHAGAGCESAYQAFDPNDPVKVYGGCYQGYIEVLDMRNREGKDIQAYPSLNLAVEPKKMKYRFNWNAPIVASPHDPKTIYHAANVLLKTSDGGISWQVISPDLTRNDSSKQGKGGTPFTNEGAGGENYNTIMYMVESALEKGVIWAGSDCGLVHMTNDGGKSWKNVTPTGLPEALVNSIELSPHEKGVAYVAATRYKFNDFGSYAYKTTDYGKTWVRINEGIRKDDFLRVIREDNKRKGLLYGGAERGFYISYDGGAHWQQMQLNLPNVPVTDLMIRDNDLVAATAGRAFWILDDLASLQQHGGDDVLKIFEPKPAYRYAGAALPKEADAYEGVSAPGGVIIDYQLPSGVGDDTVRLEIFDAAGQLVRTFTNKKDESFKPYPGGPSAKKLLPDGKGLNRFLWDMRTEQLPDVKNVFIYGNYSGHMVAPGKYRAKLTVGDRSSAADIVLKADPAVDPAPAVWQEQQQYLQQVSADITEMHKAVNSVRDARKQLESLNANLKNAAQYKPLLEEGEMLTKKMVDWEKQVVEDRITNGQDVINWPSKLNAEFFNLKGLADARDPRITEGLKKRLADLEAEWGQYKKQFEQELRPAVEAFNGKYKAAGAPAVLIQ